MYALTLWRPWDQLIVRGYKPIENRPWHPVPERIGMRFAIHAGKVFDRTCIPMAVSLGVPISFFDNVDKPELRSAIVGVATYIGTLPEQTTARWYFGPGDGARRNYGWILASPHPLLHPIPCKGAMGLWKVPLAIEAQIEEQLARFGGGQAA